MHTQVYISDNREFADENPCDDLSNIAHNDVLLLTRARYLLVVVIDEFFFG